MKTLFLCFLIKIVEVLCYTPDYPNSEIPKPDTVFNFTNKNINKIPETIAKYIISRKNNTLLTENPTSIIWNNLLDNNMKNNTIAKEISSTDNVKKVQMIKSMPYKYIEVIHYVPIKVTTSGGAKKVILDTNSSLDNMQKVFVSKDNLREMQKVILDGSNIQNKDDLNKVYKSIVNEKNVHKINNLNNMQEVIDDGRSNFKKIIIYKNGHTNTGTVIDKDVLNIDKKALLDSLGYFVRYPPKGDYVESKIVFIQILHNFIKYLEDRGISSLEILEYLRRQRAVANKGFEVLFTNEDQNSGDYTKVIHLNDNNNLRNEEIMSTIEKQALLNSDHYLVPNSLKEEDLFAIKNKEIYILILRDFAKYLIQKGITDSQIMEYLERAQKVETGEEAKEITQQSLNRNEELALNTNEEVEKGIKLNENLYTTDSSISQETINLQENSKNYEVINNDSTIYVENRLDTSRKQELKTNLSKYIQTPETLEKTADTSKSENSDEDIENINSYKILEDDNKMNPIKNIIENLHEKIPLDNNITTESQTLRNVKTSDEFQTTVISLPIDYNGRRDHNIKSDFSIEPEKEEIKKDNVMSVNDKENINTEVNKDIVEQNKSNTSTRLKSLSELDIPNDKLNTNNENVKYENISLQKSIIPNDDTENHKNIKVYNSTENILNVPNVSSLDTADKDKSNKNEDIYIQKDNIDFVDLWTSEKPNLTSIFDIESPKLTNIHTKADNIEKDDKDIPMNKDNMDFIDLWTSEKPNLTSIFDIESSKLTNIHTKVDNEENEDKFISLNKDNIDFIDLWTSEKPNLASLFDIESSKLNSVDINSHNTDALSKDEDVNILKDNKDLWTSEKPNFNGIFDIKSAKIKNFHINNDKDTNIKQLHYDTKYVNKEESTIDAINEIVKLRKVLSKLIVILKLILNELNPNNNPIYNNTIRKLFKNELVNSHQINMKTNLEANDIVLIEKLKLLNTILTLLTNTKCNNDLDLQKIISKYVHSDDFNDISLTNDDLKQKLLLLVKLLRFEGIPREQIMKIVRISLINTINPVTVRTYQNNFLNSLLNNLQLSLYKSLLSMVV